MKDLPELEGQLNPAEREQIRIALTELLPKQPICLEVGTYRGGGSTLEILKTLARADGHLWGIEASQKVFVEMKEALRARQPALCQRFTPVCGFSQAVIPSLIREGKLPRVDFVFLDGGNNPREQMEEFYLLDPHLPVGSVLMAHDVFLRKGKWLRRFLPQLDHYQVAILPISTEGMLLARKTSTRPSMGSRIRALLMLGLCQLSPLELAAHWTPKGFRGWLFGLLPGRWSSVIADGRKIGRAHV